MIRFTTIAFEFSFSQGIIPFVFDLVVAVLSKSVSGSESLHRTEKSPADSAGDFALLQRNVCGERAVCRGSDSFFAISAIAAAVAGHFHTAGLAAFPEMGNIQLFLGDRIAPAVVELKMDRLALIAQP